MTHFVINMVAYFWHRHDFGRHSFILICLDIIMISYDIILVCWHLSFVDKLSRHSTIHTAKSRDSYLVLGTFFTTLPASAIHIIFCKHRFIVTCHQRYHDKSTLVILTFKILKNKTYWELILGSLSYLLELKDPRTLTRSPYI